MRTDEDMVGWMFAYSKVSKRTAAALSEKRTAALSLAFKCSVLLAMMLSRCGTR
jgi:hypothetical protein